MISSRFVLVRPFWRKVARVKHITRRLQSPKNLETRGFLGNPGQGAAPPAGAIRGTYPIFAIISRPDTPPQQMKRKIHFCVILFVVLPLTPPSWANNVRPTQRKGQSQWMRSL
ncbi:hypothetical protein [Pontitalea aquivivens]|uniref:hypothetical protein n=1 Tax=Pontitalea aquivivens TaxID=3388663 RepID=UPI003970795C